MSRERLTAPGHVGDYLWQKAVAEIGHEALGLVMAYQAGRADAAREVLAKDQRHTHDAALDILIESQTMWEDQVEQ